MSRRTLYWALAIGGGLALVVIIVRVLPEIWPESDFALIDLLILGVLRDAQPLGAYSRFDWSHPGPLYFQLLAPLYWLSGYRHLAVLAGAALLNVGNIAGLLYVVRRRSASSSLLLALVVMLGLYLSQAWQLLASAWNPHIPILALAFLVACAAATPSAPVLWLPLSVGVASFVAQTHVGFVAPGCAVLATALLGVALDARRQRSWALFRRSIVAAAVAGAVVWALPILDEVRPAGQHNLARLVSFAQHTEPMESRAANRLFAAYFVAPFARDLSLPWGKRLHPSRDRAAQVTAVVQATLLLIATAIWWRRGRHFEARFALAVFVASAAAFLTVQRLEPTPNDHAVFWVSVLGVLAWAVVAALVVEPILLRVERRWHALPRLTGWAARVAVAVAAIVAVIQINERRRDPVHASRRISSWVSAIEGDPAVRPSGFVIDVPQDFWAPVAGVVLQFDRRGFHPHVNRGRVMMFGRRFAPNGTEPTTLRFATRGLYADDWQYRRNYREVARLADVVICVEETVSTIVRSIGTLDLVSSTSISSTNLRALSDGERLGSSPAAGGTVTFPDSTAWLGIGRPAADVVGVRLAGQAGSTWRVECAGHEPSATAFTTAGRIAIGDGELTQGEALLRNLDTCRQIRLRSVSEAPAWLSEVELLASTTRAR